MAHGGSCNGELNEQRKELQKFLIKKATKGIKEAG
jgi:hypothetical protein